MKANSFILCEMTSAILAPQRFDLISKTNFDALVLHPGLAALRAAWKTSVVITVYVYQKCSNCRDALKWLDEHKVPYTQKAIRDTPPSPVELKAALKLLGGDIRKLFNSSGIDYRALGMKDKLPQMTTDEAIGMLSQNGNLVKRPFVIGKELALVGFKEDEWNKML